MSVEFGDVVVGHGVHPSLDDNGTVHMAYWETVDDDVVMLRMYADHDRDLVFDLIDAMPTVGDQWKNTDGDGYGDNPLGPLPDACPVDAGPSSFIFHGCDDYDTDGYRDSIDGCDDEGGTSWIDRYGCEDLIRTDGRTTTHRTLTATCSRATGNRPLTRTAMASATTTALIVVPSPSLTPTPVRATFSPTSRRSTWTRTATASATTTRTPCTEISARSTTVNPIGTETVAWTATATAPATPRARAPSWSGTPPSTVPMCGPLTARNGPTAMVTVSATTSQRTQRTPTDSRCVERLPTTPTRTVMQTTGPSITTVPTPKAFNSIPARPSGAIQHGETLTVYAYGCPDSDGDGYTDSYVYDIDQNTGLRINELGDAFPEEPTQSKDNDGDGFGDNPSGLTATSAPPFPASPRAPKGVGCRIIDVNDDDGDGVINELDLLCPNTPPVNPSTRTDVHNPSLDDDDDGVKNNADLCPSTLLGESVDDDGCSVEQRNTDSDGDGLNDPDDDCPNTEAGEGRG